jgi:hypothetical protein
MECKSQFSFRLPFANTCLTLAALSLSGRKTALLIEKGSSGLGSDPTRLGEK